MSPIEEAKRILADLEGLLADPSLSKAACLFAEDFCAVSKGEVFSLPAPEHQLLLIEGLRRTAQSYGLQSVDRRILDVRAEDENTLHSIHSSSWFADGKLITAPFSTLLTHKKVGGQYRIARMQISSLAPCSMARDLAAFKTSFADTAALDHVQLTVDRMSQAVLTRDVEQFLICMRTPFVMQWDNEAQVLETECALRERFRYVVHDLHVRGVTEVFRRVKSVSAPKDDQLFATCTTYMLAGTSLVMESVTNNIWFARAADDTWVATGLLNPMLPPATRLNPAEQTAAAPQPHTS